MERFKNLIVVCCHATYTGDGVDVSETQWILQSFQRSNHDTGKQGEHETFIEHILAGRRALQKDPHSLLVFSGGRTAHEHISEAAGYGILLKGMSDVQERLNDRTLLDEYATDSYQNLIFSILLYRKHTGAYPQSVTVITHAFKDRRFLDLHGPAIRWPAHRIRVQGINPPFTRNELTETQTGEERNAYGMFARDRYGAHPPLSSKREARRWSQEHLKNIMFDGIDPVVENLMMWDGGNDGSEMFPERLPWED